MNDRIATLLNKARGFNAAPISVAQDLSACGPTDLFSFEDVPLQDRCRWFVRRGATTKFTRGFRSKDEANAWINAFGYRLDWRAGYVFRLRGDSVEMAIVDRRGNVAAS